MPDNNTNETDFDLLILGGGPGGYVAALYAALHKGMRVAIIEKERLGGVCLNWGCIPSKTMAKGAELYQTMQHNAAEYGITGNLAFDFGTLMRRKDTVVNQLVGGIYALMKARKVTVIGGTGVLTKPNTITVKTAEGVQEYTAKKIILATGSSISNIPIPGADLPGVLNSDDAVSLEELPRRMTIIGGGYIGMEFASIFSALGTKVTVLEVLPRILRLTDEEIVRRFSALIKQQGVEINTEVKVQQIVEAEGGLRTLISDKAGQARQFDSDVVLIAGGRTPNVAGTGATDLGIALDAGGRAIKVNGRMETSIPGVYAIGDVVGGIMLAHVASYEGEVAIDNIVGHSREADYHAVPDCIFTLPEIASVGVSESQAKEKGIPYKVGKFPFTALGRAQTMGETSGLVKIVTDPGSGVVIGMQVMGPHASDLIAEGALAVQLGVKASEIAGTIHTHPTLPEAVQEAAFGAVSGGYIHFG